MCWGIVVRMHNHALDLCPGTLWSRSWPLQPLPANRCLRSQKKSFPELERHLPGMIPNLVGSPPPTILRRNGGSILS